jgi:DNA-binding transcriptional ArsR family regulator
MNSAAPDADQPTDVVEPTTAEMSMPAVLAALADPNRLALVRTIAVHGHGGCTKTAALAGLTLSKSTLSHHFRTLREAGVLHAWYVGATKFVTLRSDDLESRFPGLLTAVVNGG